MNVEKRIEVLKAMGTILEAVSDDAIYEDFQLRVPIQEDLDRNLDDYVQDSGFSETLEWFRLLMSRASKDGGLWCDGVSSEDRIFKDAELKIYSAAKRSIAPNAIVRSNDTRWFISGIFHHTIFVADSFQVYRTNKLVDVEEYLNNREVQKDTPCYNDLDAAEERMLSRALVKALKAGAVEGLTLKDAETIEANLKANDRKGNEW